MSLGRSAPFLLLAILAPPAPGAAEEPGPTLAEHVFKNIQVFRGAKASEIIPAMNFMTGALGVRCEFCHVTTEKGPWPLEKDDKPEKQTARKMVLMTREINERHFDGKGEVTCASCHNGHGKPLAVPPLPPLPPRKEAGSAPDPRAVVDAYEAAIGGRAAWEGLKSLALRGKLQSEGDSYELTVTKAQDRLLILAKGGKGIFGEGFDGSQGWRRFPDNAFVLEEGLELAKIRRESNLLAPVRIRDREISGGGRAQVGGVEAIVVRVGGRDPVRERLFFDPVSHLLLRRLVLTETLLGPLPEQTDYADYRLVGGVKIPFRVEEADGQGVEVSTFEEAKPNVPVDPKAFAKPEVPAPKP